MNRILLFLLLISAITASAQQQFDISIQPSVSLTNIPAIHSFAYAKWNGKMFFLGGRKNGIHGFQPYNGFPPSNQNDSVYIFDPLTNQLLQAPTNYFTDTILHDIVSAAFNQFVQKDSMLYIVGGYGYSQTNVDYITFPYLVACNLNSLLNHIQNGNSIEQDFRKINDSNLAVTGGNMVLMDSTVYLVFGQKFDGRYAVIDTLGFFVQEYSNEIRMFHISDDGINLSINNYTVNHDTANFHRRDYNLIPQIFPDRSYGVTAFGGVFQYGINLPFLNPIDIHPASVNVISNFNQNLNQYSTATIPIYDSLNNTMHTVFLGGIGEYQYDATGTQLIHDTLVPFVKTISKVTRASDSTLTEYLLPQQMPGYLGTNAYFVASPAIDLYGYDIINLNHLDTGNTLIGYMVGGILSTDSNISEISSLLSSASSVVYEIHLTKAMNTGISEIALHDDVLNFIAYPNPFEKSVTIDFELKFQQQVSLIVYDASGRKIEEIMKQTLSQGKHNYKWHPDNLENSTFFIRLTTGKYSKTLKVVNH